MANNSPGLPDSVLWLLDPGEEMRQEILKVLDRVKNRVFFAENLEISEHLGRVGHANLFLDSFPLEPIQQPATLCV